MLTRSAPHSTTSPSLESSWPTSNLSFSSFDCINCSSHNSVSSWEYTFPASATAVLGEGCNEATPASFVTKFFCGLFCGILEGFFGGVKDNLLLPGRGEPPEACSDLRGAWERNIFRAFWMGVGIFLASPLGLLLLAEELLACEALSF